MKRLAHTVCLRSEVAFSVLYSGVLLARATEKDAGMQASIGPARA